MPTDALAAVDALLSSFDAAADPEERAHVAGKLLRTRVTDERIRAALVRVLGEDPFRGSEYLARYGDTRSVADLVRALESEDLRNNADCDICAAHHALAIATAVALLGGTLSEEQNAIVDELAEAARRLWQPGPDASPSAPIPTGPATRDPRPGRNAPCPCGSGKKFKKCCGGDAEPRH